jgi:hypothetical protein
MSNREPGGSGKTDILQGTLDIMVLQTLTTLGPVHGYAIAARLQQVSNGAIRLNWGRCIQDSCVWNNVGSCAGNGV